MKRTLFPLWLLLFSVSLIGCVNLASGGPQSIWLTMFLVVLLAVSCTQILPNNEKTSENNPTDGSVKEQQKGRWETCCENGKISKCFCPEGMACNYGRFQDCGSGTCKTAGSCEPTTPDVKPDVKPDTRPDVTPDKKGEWQGCCKDGKVEKCFCPAGVSCNFMYKSCGSGTCVSPRESCEPTTPDAKPDVKPDVTPDKRPDVKPDVQPDMTPEKKGTWQQCCKSGKISKCFCPQGMACNYGRYKDCGAGVCVFDPRAACPEPSVPEVRPEPPPPEKKGTWQKCCKSGKIDKCFCPQGMACNYGMYADCGNGTCAAGGQKCPP